MLSQHAQAYVCAMVQTCHAVGDAIVGCNQLVRSLSLFNFVSSLVILLCINAVIVSIEPVRSKLGPSPQLLRIQPHLHRL